MEFLRVILNRAKHMGNKMDIQLCCKTREAFNVRFIGVVTREVLRPDDKSWTLATIYCLTGKLGINVEFGVVSFVA